VPELTDNILNSEDTLSAAKRAYYRSPDGIADFFKQQLQITTKSVGTEAKILLVPNPVQLPVLKDDLEHPSTSAPGLNQCFGGSVYQGRPYPRTPL